MSGDVGSWLSLGDSADPIIVGYWRTMTVARKYMLPWDQTRHVSTVVLPCKACFFSNVFSVRVMPSG
jgi:hypothetical protein